MTAGLVEFVAESGGGPPQSKTCRLLHDFNLRGSVLECAGPPALLNPP